MLKQFVFNAVLFWVVSYLGQKNNVSCLVLAVVFAGLHHVFTKHVQYEFFNYMPDTRPIPPCPPGAVPGDKNGMDCKLKSDIHGI